MSAAITPFNAERGTLFPVEGSKSEDKSRIKLGFLAKRLSDPTQF
jgi:hypothetical protein